MLIKHTRDKINMNKKVVFLCNNVALLEQQADVIRKTTGLVTGTYCGAHGVDGWNLDKWRLELSQHQVLVMIHQVLLDALSRGYVKIPELALIIFDECHHATKVTIIKEAKVRLKNFSFETQTYFRITATGKL